jgi:hypothetical protein
MLFSPIVQCLFGFLHGDHPAKLVLRVISDEDVVAGFQYVTFLEFVKEIFIIGYEKGSFRKCTYNQWD